MSDGKLTDRQLDRVRATADGTDITFIATYSRGRRGGFTAEAFHNELDGLEALSLASFLRSYARDLEDNVESQGMLGEEL